VSQVLSILCLVLIPSWMKSLTPTTSIMTLVCVWIVFCASFDKGYARPVAGEWLRGVGFASFSLYLCHPAALLMGREIGLLLGSSFFNRQLRAKRHRRIGGPVAHNYVHSAIISADRVSDTAHRITDRLRDPPCHEAGLSRLSVEKSAGVAPGRRA